MLNDAKTKYLYAFEDAFRAKCLQAGIQPAKWKTGMWSNAHMYYGMGTALEDAVAKWFAHVKKVEKSKKN